MADVESTVPLQPHLDSLEALTTRYANEPARLGGLGWPIINRKCFQEANKQLLHAQRTRRPMLIDGLRGHGKMTMLAILFPNLNSEL